MIVAVMVVTAAFSRPTNASLRNGVCSGSSVLIHRPHSAWRESAGRKSRVKHSAKACQNVKIISLVLVSW